MTGARFGLALGTFCATALFAQSGSPAITPAHLPRLLSDPVSGPVQYKVSLTSASRINAAAVDASGNAYIGGWTYVALPATPGAFRSSFAPCAAVPMTAYSGHPACSWAFVSKLAPDGTILWLTYLPEPNGDSSISYIAVDRTGSVYLVGYSSPANGSPPAFPVTPGAFDTTRPGLFIAKLNNSGSTLLYATYFNHGELDAFAVDSNGNVCLGMRPWPLNDLPVVNPLPGSAPGQYSGYLAKLNSTGTALLFATSVNGSDAESLIMALAAGPSGDLYIAGWCRGACVPTAPGAFQTSLPAAGGETVFVIRLKNDGTVVYSTLFGGGFVDGIAVDGSGNATVAGHATEPAEIPVTEGAFQAKSTDALPPLFVTDTAFIAKFNAAGSALLYSTYFGGSLGTAIKGLALDSGENVVFAGYSESADLPMTSDSWHPCNPRGFVFAGVSTDFVGRLSHDGATLLSASFIPPAEDQDNGTGGSQLSLAGVDSGGDLYLFGFQFDTPVVIRYRFTPRPKGSVACVTSVTHGYESAMSPLGWMEIRGNGIGTALSSSPPLTSAGTLPTSYGGLQVFVDNTPAPLLKIEADRITFVSPITNYRGGAAAIFVARNGVMTTELETTVVPATPAVITTNAVESSSIAAFNQDGSLNSPQNPATDGSIITMYATGLGATSAYLAPGSIAKASGSLIETVGVMVYGVKADVLYAGPAPGLLAGVYQINFRVPATTAAKFQAGFADVSVQAGGQKSQNLVGIYVQ
jgi:uncharacterized protein (TIGR03437 family)